MVDIREARADDDLELARIDFDSWSPANSPSARWAPERPFFGAPTGTRVDDVRVAHERGRILGYVKLADRNDRAATCRITGLAVDAAARGRGTGRLLVNAALHLAADRGFAGVDLKVLGTNTAALALYRRAGFVEIERVIGRFPIEGAPVDDLTLLAEI